MNIAAGDVVELLSGQGGPMNVRSTSDTKALCTWFDNQGKRHMDVYPLANLLLLMKMPADRERERSEGPMSRF